MRPGADRHQADVLAPIERLGSAIRRFPMWQGSVGRTPRKTTGVVGAGVEERTLRMLAILRRSGCEQRSKVFFKGLHALPQHARMAPVNHLGF